ncbi:hypothetical protein [Klebsiella pneumoniae]|uniref:hypothetical protein n=1 Tax=Klebsiella pneumoniae TaxID=573 RepID=UPI003D9551C9
MVVTTSAIDQPEPAAYCSLEAKGDEATFWKLLDERLVLTRKALMTRIIAFVSKA